MYQLTSLLVHAVCDGSFLNDPIDSNFLDTMEDYDEERDNTIITAPDVHGRTHQIALVKRLAIEVALTS